MPANLKPLWRCPKCGERFVTKNLWHSCGNFNLEDLFSKSEPHVFELFEQFSRMVEACGPVKMIPQKTRAVFQVRMRFASCYPRKSYLLCGIVLRRKIDSPRIRKIEEFGSVILHEVRLIGPNDLDAELHDWLRESYKVGAQEFLPD